MTVSYTFIVKSVLEPDEIKTNLSKWWHGDDYSVEVLKNNGFTVCFFQSCYREEIEEKMLLESFSYLKSIIKNKEILYARCDDPYYLDVPIFPRILKFDDIFTDEFCPNYYDGQQYNYRIET